MTLPFSLPDWLPGWALIALLLPVMLYGLALLTMPFSVLGLRARLERLDARLDEIQGEIRALALRSAEPARRTADPQAANLDIPRFDLPPIPAQPAPQPAAAQRPATLDQPAGLVRTPPPRSPMPDPVLRAQPVPQAPPPSFMAPPVPTPPIPTPRAPTDDPPLRRPLPARLPPTRPDSTRTEPRLDWPHD